MIIKTCASSANLGPGFDCFGIAWQLYNTMEFTPCDKLVIEGCDTRFQNADNLAYVAYLAALTAAGRSAEPVKIRFISSDIPVSRGLGSSAALIVAGVLAANALCLLGLSAEELFAVATAVEGHPDNIAPALFGGLTASAMDGGKALTASFPLSSALRFTALVPDFELSTHSSRSVLPERIARTDAVFNVSRAALLLKGLENGDAELLRAGLCDKLHQPYRLPLIAGADKAAELVLSLGAIGWCISGAGSTLLCVSDDDAFHAKLSAALPSVLPGWRALELTPDMSGALA